MNRTANTLGLQPTFSGRFDFVSLYLPSYQSLLRSCQVHDITFYIYGKYITLYIIMYKRSYSCTWLVAAFILFAKTYSREDFLPYIYLLNYQTTAFR